MQFVTKIKGVKLSEMIRNDDVVQRVEKKLIKNKLYYRYNVYCMSNEL